MRVLTLEEMEILEKDRPNWSKLGKAQREAIQYQLVTSANLLHNCNDTFYNLFNDTSRYLVLMGGGGSGKSVFASQKIIHRARTEKGHKWLITRKVANTLRDSVFAQLSETISVLGYDNEFIIPKGRSSDLYISNKNTGNELLFYGLDDVEKMKSIQGITDIWIEEPSEITLQDFNQLNIRMRHRVDTYNQMILTFNPILETCFLKSLFFDKSRITI